MYFQQEASQGDFENSKKSIELLFAMEEEVDSLRREVFNRLAWVEIKSKDREDILHLVKRLDGMADYVKDSGRTILILIESESIPSEVWNRIIKISKSLVECASSLRKSIEKIEDDPKMAEKYSWEVDKWEHEIDNQNLEIWRFLIHNSKNIDPATLITLRELLLSLEETADSCADTADYLRVLIAGS